MKYIFFLIPFLLSIPTVFAETGYDYFDVTNPDGSHTWKSHEPYILNNGQYVPFVNSGLTTQTAFSNVKLNSDGSYTWNGKFSDKIVAKYADVSDLNSWTYPNAVNNDTPDVSWNGNGFVSTKISGAIGQLDYKYVLSNGVWKTQLEATNLSALTTKAFGFDQIIDLERDTISFGGVIRNLDNFNNTTFDKQFLIDNKGKVLDLLNGINFDFDLGFANLYSVTVYDTGINSSRLVFDYRTSAPLLPNELLIIDPTFSSNNPIVDGDLQDDNNDNICNGGTLTKTTGGSGINFGTVHTGNAYDCYRAFIEWDISSIPNTSIIITNSSFQFQITSRGSGAGSYSDVTPIMTGSPSVASNANLWTDIGDGVDYISNSTVFDTVGANYDLDLGAGADADIQTQLALDWFAVGLKHNAETSLADNFGEAMASEETGGATPAPTLTITYTLVKPYAVTDLSNSTTPTSSTIGLNWTAPYSGSPTQSIIGYQLNLTTPQTGSPLVYLNDTASTTANYNFTGLLFDTSYSARVTAWTNVTADHPLNNATGNVFNFTTSDSVYSGIAPTNFLMLPNGTSTSVLLLNWTASTINNLNGYRIQCEAPVGGGFSTIVSNTTTTTNNYNYTGLSVNTYYNCKVAGMNGTGRSDYSNTYSQTTYHLPDAVDDLVAAPTAISDIILTFTQPNTLYGYLTGYNINYTTPQSNNPLTVYVSTTGSSDVAYTLTGLTPQVDYSFRVAAITIHGKNVTGALVVNATSADNFEVGNLVIPPGTDSSPLAISFEVVPLNGTASDLIVTYDSTYDLACDFSYVIRNANQTYSGLTENAISGTSVYSNFTLEGINNDIINIYCWNQLNNSTNARERLGQTGSSVPLFDQIDSFQTGAFGTTGKFGAFDLITLIIVIVSMIGFNRDHPEVGVSIMAAMIGVCAYYGIIEWETTLTGAVILVVALAIANSKRGSSN